MWPHGVPRTQDVGNTQQHLWQIHLQIFFFSPDLTSKVNVWLEYRPANLHEMP